MISIDFLVQTWEMLVSSFLEGIAGFPICSLLESFKHQLQGLKMMIVQLFYL